MNNIIIQAINTRSRLRLKFDGELRTIEPYRYGRSIQGNKDLLRAYQIINHTRPQEKENWRLFDVAGISSLEILHDHIITIRSDYGPRDKQMILPYYTELR